MDRTASSAELFPGILHWQQKADCSASPRLAERFSVEHVTRLDQRRLLFLTAAAFLRNKGPVGFDGLTQIHFEGDDFRDLSHEAVRGCPAYPVRERRRAQHSGGISQSARLTPAPVPPRTRTPEPFPQELGFRSRAKPAQGASALAWATSARPAQNTRGLASTVPTLQHLLQRPNCQVQSCPQKLPPRWYGCAATKSPGRGSADLRSDGFNLTRAVVADRPGNHRHRATRHIQRRFGLAVSAVDAHPRHLDEHAPAEWDGVE